MPATSLPEIHVHASFPLSVMPGADLDLENSNWRWVHCLTFPIKTLTVLQLSPKPYKWIRFAIGVVVGAVGHLSSSSDSLSVVDYEDGLPTEVTNLYYYTGDEEKRRMFPTDPDMGRSNLTSSVASTRRLHFRDEVAERDGRTCVMTGLRLDSCDAVHLLAHSKGDTYITTYTRHRSRDPTGGDIIQEIDSVRNGLILNSVTHRVLGTHVAFLMTPNFAMTTTDIDSTAPPNSSRYTAHPFLLGEAFLLGGPGGPATNSTLRISDTPEWPPAILFDAVYASAVLHHFGTQVLKDRVTTTWKDIFYPDGVTTMAHANYKAITTDERARTAERTENQARYEAPGVPDTFDMLMALPYIMVPQEHLKATIRETQEKADATEQRRVQERVETWMEQITTT